MSVTSTPTDFDALWARSLANPVQPAAPTVQPTMDLSLGTVLDRYVTVLDPAIQSGKVDAASGAAVKERIADLKAALGKIDDRGLMAAEVAQRTAQLAANPPATTPLGASVPPGGMA